MRVNAGSRFDDDRPRTTLSMALEGETYRIGLAYYHRRSDGGLHTFAMNLGAELPARLPVGARAYPVIDAMGDVLRARVVKRTSPEGRALKVAVGTALTSHVPTRGARRGLVIAAVIRRERARRGLGRR